MAANKKKATARHTEDTPVKSFLDMIAPSVVQFNPDHFICGNTFRCVWALREYPTQTDEQALLRHLGEKDGITLRIYTRQLTPAEEDRILHNAANKNRMNKSNPNDLRQTIIAETNLQDMISMEGSRHRNKEPLFHCAVYIELTAPDYDALKLLQTDVLTELVRSKLNVDRLLLRQQQGFCCASPVGYNAFGAQFERVLPANSVANLYPFNYSGKTDAKGFYVGRDKYGSNILVDFDQRDEDKTSESAVHGHDDQQEHLQYQWAGGTPQRKYANMLDNLIPQHDAHTTAAWIAFAEELADGVENGFEREAASLVAAFQEISERFDPKVVNTIYQTIHVPDNTLLSNEIIPAAEAAEQGASVQEISDMAADGLFGGGPMPTLKM